jgi:maleate isomerase
VTVETLARRLREELQASRVTIRLGPRRDYPVVAEATEAGVAAIAGDTSVPQASAATVRWVAAHLRTLAVDDVERSELRPPAALVDAYAIRAFIMAPIVHHGALYGTVSVHEVGRPRTWTAADVAAAERVATTMEEQVSRGEGTVAGCPAG